MNKSIHQFSFKDLSGKTIDFSQYKDKVLLIVNTASECGFTPQFEEMEEIYKEYKDRGFEVLAFPSNDFGGQEPLSGDKLEEFCQVNYGVSFKVFQKSPVKGDDANDIFKFLSSKKLNGQFGSTPKWNFQKYLIDKNGVPVDYYFSITKPNSKKIKKAIEKLLTKN